MKKVLTPIIFILFCLFINSINFWDAYCSGNECIEKYNERIDKYNNALERKDYLTCLEALEQAKEYSDYRQDEIDSQIQNISEYLWSLYSQKENYTEALKYYKKALTISETPETLYNVWWICYKLGQYKMWIPYLNKAKQKASNSDLYNDIVKLLDYMTEMSEYEDVKNNRKTDDEYWFYQYYLSGIDIFDARDKLPKNTKKVVIAIVDDGVNINHPDFKGKIWVNKKEIAWDWIDNDKNGYIDDYNWWNFVKNNNSISSPGEHGTMVAWVIAANIDNKVWISGIVPNVEIMVLNVFWSNWSADGEDIIEAVNYAINNGANIINLSLTQEDQSNYTTSYDSVIKKAYEKWIVVVVSAWNGDEEKHEIGINTTVTKISPVCNEKNKKTIIWVGSLSKEWTQSKRSNYWECVDLFMYWEEIFTTAVNPDGEPYAKAEWTSFSAPIISWIIWLWYNMVWQIDPDKVYDNLKKSIKWNIVNAAKYLDNLSTSLGELWNAISWLMESWFTVAKSPSDFHYNRSIRRDEAAKLFVLYAKKFGKDVIVADDDQCIFSDLWEVSKDLRPYVINACRYWFLKWKWKWKFKPADQLSNAQAITVFMRMYSWKKDESWNHYADRYFIEAYKLWLIKWLTIWDYNNYEIWATRWDIAILMYRWANLITQ